MICSARSTASSVRLLSAQQREECPLHEAYARPHASRERDPLGPLAGPIPPEVLEVDHSRCHLAEGAMEEQISASGVEPDREEARPPGRLDLEEALHLADDETPRL
jgi:hypothetical protein